MTQLPLMRSFKDQHGVETFYYEWPAAKPKAVLQLVHGMGDHSLRYQELAAALNRVGISVYANDHRGHGATGQTQLALGEISGMGHLGVGGMKAVYEAEYLFTQIIRRENVGLPLVLLGHSWGSFIAQHLLAKHPSDFKAVILTGTSLMLPGYLGSGDFNAKFAETPNATGYEWLSRDPQVAKDFEADPLTFYADAFKVFGLANTLQIAGLPSRKTPSDLPILIQIGSEDPVGGEKSAAALLKAYRRAGVVDVELIVYHGARHEIFNETNKDEVTADTLNWLKSVLP
ncbi:MAG: hypothetical protein RL556_574, partial [Actinomycetota bacterium]